MSVKDIEFATGLSNSNIKRWMDGDSKYNKKGLIQEGKLKEYRLGVDPKAKEGEEGRGTLVYMMPQEKTGKALQKSSPTSFGKGVEELENFTELMQRGARIGLTLSILYILVRGIAEQSLMDWLVADIVVVFAFSLICLMMFLGAYVGHALDMFENPPQTSKQMFNSLDIPPKSGKGWWFGAGAVVTIGMVTVVAMYFGYPSKIAPLAGLGVVVLEMMVIGAGGRNAEFVLKTIRASGAVGRGNRRVERR
tara:strand:- start:140 stop:889 length:750 start_codon:yes stop_codon:yes gene_type:complete